MEQQQQRVRLQVKVGDDTLVMEFSKSATVGEIIPQIEQMASELRDDGKKGYGQSDSK